MRRLPLAPVVPAGTAEATCVFAPPMTTVETFALLVTVFLSLTAASPVALPFGVFRTAVVGDICLDLVLLDGMGVATSGSCCVDPGASVAAGGLPSPVRVIPAAAAAAPAPLRLPEPDFGDAASFCCSVHQLSIALKISA